RVGDEQRQAGAEQPDQEHLAPEPGVIVVAFFAPHEALIGKAPSADKGFVRILIVDDHPTTRRALAALLGQPDFSVVGEAGDGEAALSGEVARRLLEQVREGGARGVPDEIAGSLSAREVEVLLLLDEHLGTDEIAARLFISEHTVRSHVKSLLRKLNVSSRREALEALNQARAA